jgi:hypothetical protein
MEWLGVVLNLAIIVASGIVFISIAEYVLGLFIRIK